MKIGLKKKKTKNGMIYILIFRPIVYQNYIKPRGVIIYKLAMDMDYII